jgi:hypothetical protein
MTFLLTRWHNIQMDASSRHFSRWRDKSKTRFFFQGANAACPHDAILYKDSSSNRSKYINPL